MALVSVIIPVYNGARYLKRTLEAIQAQTYTNFEVICINDSSTDNSLEILNDFASHDKRIRVFSKPNGGTAAKAVSFGLQYAIGDFMMYSSQDDFFSPDLLEKNILRISETGADAVVPDMCAYIDERNNKITSGINGDREKIITGEDAFILSLTWSIHGFVLWNMNLVKEIGWETYGINSDEYTTRMLYFHSKSVAFSNGIFYYFQGNDAAITKKWNISQFGYIDTTLKLLNFVIQHKLSEQCRLCCITNLANDLCRLMILYQNAKQSLTLVERSNAYRLLKAKYRTYYPLIKTAPGFGSWLKTCTWVNLYSYGIYIKSKNKFLRHSN